MTDSALDGLRVADFSRVLSGPFATMMLADLGASVVKVERPGGGDDTRAWGPPFDADGNATYFLAANRNKSSVTLDLRAPEGLAHARALVAECDVVVENFRPGVMSRLGLGYEDLAADRPGLVYCSINAFGTGAGAGLPGYDLIVQAVGGLMSVTGAPDGEPEKVGAALVDVLSGLFASVGILAALRHRDLTGLGQRVEVDLLTALLSALVNQSTAFTAGGVTPGRLGNAHPSIAPYETLRAGDGELAVAAGNQRQFAALCGALGVPDAMLDPRFVDNGARVRHRAELRSVLESALRTRGAQEWVRVLTDAGVPAGAVNDIGQAFALAERLGLEPTVSIPREDGTASVLPRNPIRLSRTPVQYRLAPPQL